MIDIGKIKEIRVELNGKTRLFPAKNLFTLPTDHGILYASEGEAVAGFRMKGDRLFDVFDPSLEVGRVVFTG